MAEKCSEIKALMNAALDDELDPEARVRFDEHLAACPACRREYEVLTRAVAAFEAAPRLEPSPTFAADVVRRARLAKGREARGRRAFARVTIAASAAAAAVAAGAWAWLFKPALGAAAAGAFNGLVTAVVDYWKVARALAVPAHVMGKLVSALGSAGSQLAWEGLKSSSAVYAGAFVAVALFYLVWRAGSRAAAPLVRVI
ncbi:MAG TPA: zf-HC2 domain-containing protein [bacterium]|nr:zf-HC2 domain-containing protein [bacterium]